MVRNVKQEASEWIARLNADEVTAEDRARFDSWKRADPLNSQVFEALSQTWRRFVDAGPLVRTAACAEALDSAPAGRPRRRWSAVLAAAAVLVVLLTGAYLQWLAPATRFASAVGQQLTVPLPDGSSMELNSNSVARVDYSSRQRVIRLERGEAFFRVAHEASRPFWVTAREGWVGAVGTEFNVYLRATGLRVTVSEGTVKAGESRDGLSSEQSGERNTPSWVTLTGGQQADLEARSAVKRALSAEELAEAVAWRTGMVSFENQPLAEVVAELNRYSAEQLVLQDEALRALPVGGTFQAGPKGAAALLRMLEQNFAVRVRRDGTRVFLDPPAHPAQP
jgi:transmembrane sensor